MMIASLVPTLRAVDGPRIEAPALGETLLGPTTVRLDPSGPPGTIDRIDVYVNGTLVGSATAPEWSIAFDAGTGETRFRIQAVSFAADRVVARAERTFRGASISEYERVDLVQLYPVVRTPSGEYEKGLSRDEFRVFEDDVEVPIAHFATEVTSLDVVFLLDVSASMSGKLGQLQAAAADFVSELGALDLVGLWTFDHAVRELSPLTLNHDEVLSGIWGLQPGGGTALYDAILRVIAESLEHISGRKAVFLFSDGIDQHSFSSLERVLDEARDHDVMFYCIGAGEDEDSVVARKDLRTLAERTGGQAYFIRNARQMDGAFEAVLKDLRAQYVISYRPPDGPEGIRRVRIEALHRYKVRHREFYHYTKSGVE